MNCDTCIGQQGTASSRVTPECNCPNGYTGNYPHTDDCLEKYALWVDPGPWNGQINILDHDDYLPVCDSGFD